MVYKKYIISAIGALTLFTSSTFADSNFVVSSVSEISNNKLNVEFSDNLDKNSEFDFKIIEKWEIISNEIRDYNLKNKAILDLSSDIEAWGSYSLVSVYWTEGEMTFTLPEKIGNLELLNEKVLNPGEQEIEWIKIIDHKKIEVNFTKDIEEDFSMKLIRNIDVESYNFVSDNSVEVKLTDILSNNTDYTLVILSAFNADMEKISLDNSIYDFSIWDYIPEEVVVEEVISEDISEENNNENVESSQDETIDTETIKVPVEDLEPREILEVAADEDVELPKSWTKENILILISILFAAIAIFWQKLIKKA